MELCPVCETPQPAGALECETCGRIFHAAVDASAAAAALPELEPTSLVDEGLQVADDVVPGLEATSLADLAGSGTTFEVVEAVAELESTLLADPLELVLVEDLPDMERTKQEVPAVAATPVSNVVLCPGCGATGQAVGVYCDRCGSRLTRPQAAAPQASAAEVAVSAEDAPTRCKACGAQRLRNGICLDCGTLTVSA